MKYFPTYAAGHFALTLSALAGLCSATPSFAADNLTKVRMSLTLCWHGKFFPIQYQRKHTAFVSNGEPLRFQSAVCHAHK